MAQQRDRQWGQNLLQKKRWGVAFIGALLCFLALPATGQAHAILQHSDPERNALLVAPPSQVRLWFTERLNPTFSTVYVINAAQDTVKDVTNPRYHLDASDAHITPNNPLEMDVSLKLLPPGIYAVIYRTQSADDGHIAAGNFLFSIKGADGTVPEHKGPLPPLPSFGRVTSTGQIDGTMLFSLFMTTLLEVAIVFWSAAQCWLMFLMPHRSPGSEEQEENTWHTHGQQLHEQAAALFQQRLALPTLSLLLLAHMGILFGQALTLTNGRWDLALSPSILQGLLSSGEFSRYWLLRTVIIVLALVLACFLRQSSKRSFQTTSWIDWSNFVLSLALITTTVLSGHAAAVHPEILVYAATIDWLHLLAATLWIGGMLYLALVGLAVLQHNQGVQKGLDRVPALLALARSFSPMALAGVIIMAITGPLNATTRMQTWDQLLQTSYGRTLLVKDFLVVVLLFSSALHVFFWRPRLANDYQLVTEWQTEDSASEHKKNDAGERKRLEQHIQTQYRRLIQLLRWEPMLGIAVLLCTGLLTVFSATLLPPDTTTHTSSSTPAKPFHALLKTTDALYTLDVTITPNRFGSNQLVVKVRDQQGQIPTNMGISAFTTMLDMDMGSTSLDIQREAGGIFRADCDFSMGGHWQLRINVLANNTLHPATITDTVLL